MTTEDSDTDYSDLEDDTRVANPPKETKKAVTSGGMDKEDADSAIQDVISTAANSGLLTSSWTVVGTPPRGGESKVKSMAAEYGRKQQRSSSSSPPPPPLSSSSSLTSGGVAIPRHCQDSTSSTSSSSSSREGSYNIMPMQRIQSSEKLANQIRQMLPPKNSPKTPPRKNSLASKYADKGGVMVPNGDMAALSSDPTPIPNGDVKLLSGPTPLQNGNVTSISGPIPIPNSSTVQTPASDNQTSPRAAVSDTDGGDKRLSLGSSPAESPPGESTSCRGSVSSECPNSEGDLESSVDLRSPLVRYPHPAVAATPPKDTPTPTDTRTLKSSLKSLPSNLRDDGKGVCPGREKGGGVSGGGGGSESGGVAKKVTLCRNLDDSDIMRGEEDDKLDELGSFSKNIRSRTQTLSALTGGKRRMEIGRKKMHQHRIDMKRFSSMSTPLSSTQDAELLAKDKMNWKKELELLSPILQAKIRNMTLKRIYAEYGGKDIVTKAVSVIEEAYRTYKLHKRFQERLKEKRENRTMQRKRAQSLRQPNRRPSIMSKTNRYRSKAKQDPVAKTKEAAERLAKERLPHAHSGTRLELMEKRRRSEVSLESVGSVGSSVCHDDLAVEEEEEEDKDDEVFETKPKRKLVSL